MKRVRIYQVDIEHSHYGRGWSREKIAANTAEEAIRKAKRGRKRSERIESVVILAEADAQ